MNNITIKDRQPKKISLLGIARAFTSAQLKRYFRTLLFLLFAFHPAINVHAQNFIVNVDGFTDLSTNNLAIAGRGYKLKIINDGGSAYSGTHTLTFSPAAAIPNLCVPIASDCSTRNSCQPANGDLDISFVGGEVNLCMVMPDVGAYSFSVTDGTAIGASPGFTSRPKDFALAAISLVKRGDLPPPPSPGCDSTFTYMSEPMRLSFKLTAMSEENLVTPSYDGSKLNAAIMTIDNWKGMPANGHMGLLMTGVENARVSVSSPSVNWSSGVGEVSVDVRFARGSAPDGPYLNAAIGIAPQDDDGVTLKVFDMDADSNGANERAMVGMTELRYGRLKIANAYGSDVLPLPVNVQAQYWNGTAFANNTDDNCTPLDGNFVLGQVGTLTQPNTSVGATTGKLINGAGKIALTKPSPALTTKAITSIKTVNANLPYLPGVGTGTFGVYRGGPVIYQRELHY